MPRLLGGGLIGLLALWAAVWGALALWFAFPAEDGLRAALAMGIVALGAGGLLAAVLRRWLVVPLLPFAVAFVVLLAWWSTKNSNGSRLFMRTSGHFYRNC